MKKIILLLAIIITVLNTQAQITFQEAIGEPAEDWAISAEATSDSGYIIVGWTKSYGAGGWDIYLVKTSSTGAVQWTQTYGGPGDEVDCNVHQTFEGGYIITARTNSFGVGSADVYLIRTDASGNALWTKTVGGANWDEGHSNIQTPDSGFVHVGFTESFGSGNPDIYLIKSDKNGETQWTKTFGDTGTDHGHLIISAIDGGYMILGETNSFGAGGYDFYLVKTDTAGNLLWSKTYGGSGNEYGWDIKATKDSCYVLAGYTNSFGGSNDVYLIKVNMNGDMLWAKTLGDSSNNIGFAIRQTADAGFIIAGKTSSVTSDSGDVYIIKTDSDGTPLWTRIFGGDGDEGCQSVEQTADKGYFISGYTNSFGAGNYDFYIIKTDSMGRTSSCNLADPVALMTDVSGSTLISNPPTQSDTGGTTAIPPSSTESSGGIGIYCTPVTAVENISDNKEINIYPNPATNSIALTHPSNVLSIEIFNQLGQLVFSQQLKQSTNELIDVSKLNAGIYQIKCISTSSLTDKQFVKIN